MCSSDACAPALTTDMASSTRTGTLDITRTTGACTGSNRSMKAQRMPAATLTMTCSAVTAPAISDTRASMSWGLTVMTRVFVCRTA